jgi:hypothetical protein
MGVTAVEIADNGCDFFIHPKINPIDFRFWIFHWHVEQPWKVVTSETIFLGLKQTIFRLWILGINYHHHHRDPQDANVKHFGERKRRKKFNLRENSFTSPWEFPLYASAKLNYKPSFHYTLRNRKGWTDSPEKRVPIYSSALIQLSAF